MAEIMAEKKKKTTIKKPARQSGEVSPKGRMVKKSTVKKALVEKTTAKSVSKISSRVRKPVSAKTSRSKVDLISKYQSHKEDTGSIEVQVAVITKKISDLTKHLKNHKKDYDSRRGLLLMVGKRRRLLNYLRKSDEAKYEKLIKDLGLRK